MRRQKRPKLLNVKNLIRARLASCKTLASKREGYGEPCDVTSLSLSKRGLRERY